MAFATTEDIAARLGRSLTTGEESAVTLLLELATSLIVAEAKQTDAWATALDPVPGVLRTVCIEATTRALSNPQGLASLQETLGAYSSSVQFRDYATAGLLLTKDERRLVRRFAGTGGFAAITLETPYSGTAADDDPELVLGS